MFFFFYHKRPFPSFSFQKFCNFRFYNYVYKNFELFLYTLWATCWSSLLDECIDACAHMCINKCVCMESRGQSGVLFHRSYLVCMCMCICKYIHTYVYTGLYVYVHTYRGQMRTSGVVSLVPSIFCLRQGLLLAWKSPSRLDYLVIELHESTFLWLPSCCHC